MQKKMQTITVDEKKIGVCIIHMFAACFTVCGANCLLCIKVFEVRLYLLTTVYVLYMFVNC